MLVQTKLLPSTQLEEKTKRERNGGAIAPALDDAKTLPEQFPAKVTVSIDFFKKIHSFYFISYV
jgi:hypothetical protein